MGGNAALQLLAGISSYLLEFLKLLAISRAIFRGFLARVNKIATGSDLAWPSVRVKRGCTVVKGRSVVKCEWSNNLGTLLKTSLPLFGTHFKNNKPDRVACRSSPSMTVCMGRTCINRSQSSTFHRNEDQSWPKRRCL